jgi:hypothetical protein
MPSYQASTDELCIRDPKPYLEEQAVEDSRRLRINGTIRVSKVPLAKVATVTATLEHVGFLQVNSSQDSMGKWEVSGLKPNLPTPTCTEIKQHEKAEASIAAQERFLQQVLREVQHNAARLPELRKILTNYPDLQLRFEAHRFQLILKASNMALHLSLILNFSGCQCRGQSNVPSIPQTVRNVYGRGDGAEGSFRAHLAS